MATAVLSNVPTIISLAETTTGWSGAPDTLDPDIKVQGSNSISGAMTVNGNNDCSYTGFTPVNLNAVHLRLWFNISFVSYLAASNQIQVFISDGLNTAYWTIQNPGNYAGGWSQAVVYTGNTPTSGIRPTGNSTAVGMRFVTSSKPRNVPANCWFDAWYYGDGYDVTGGTDGDEIDWSHVAALDLVEAYGIVTKQDDIYFLAGDVKLGSGATATWFNSGQKLQFRDLPVSSTLYGITFQGTGCNIDIAGGAWGAAGLQNYFLDATDTGPSVIIAGVQFSKSGLITFAPGQSITQCIFDNCGQVYANLTTFQDNTFSNYVGTTGAYKWPTSSLTKNLEFINCELGVYIDIGLSPKNFDNIVFDDVVNNFDVNNASGNDAMVINLVNGSNANSYEVGNNIVTFASSVSLSLVVKDEDGAFIQGAFAYIDDDDLTPFIMNTTTDVNGLADVNWTGGAVAGARWRVRLYGYKPFKVIADIGAVNKEIPVTLVADPQQT